MIELWLVAAASVVGAIAGGMAGRRQQKRVQTAIDQLKELRASFEQLDADQVLVSERDRELIERLDAAPHDNDLYRRWRRLGDRASYQAGKPTGVVQRMFLDDSGTIVATLVASTGKIAVPCIMYSYTLEAEYMTLPFVYRGLALGPSSRMAYASPTIDALYERHRALIRDVPGIVEIRSAEDFVAHGRRLFAMYVAWRASLDPAALFDADAMSLAGGKPRIARRIARRLQAELPPARLVR